MTRILPQNTDTLNNPSHSFLHRVVSVDTSSPQSSIDVDASGNVTIAASAISSTAVPGTSTTQLATTEFVQVAVRSSPGKEASEYATIAALPTVVYNNGTAGVGATLKGFAVGAL